MKNKRLLAYAVLTAALASQSVFAKSDIDLTPNTVTEAEVIAAVEEVTKEDIVAAIEDYQDAEVELAQPRRSALFLHILDSVVKKSTMAEANVSSHNSQLSKLFGSDGTLL